MNSTVFQAEKSASSSSANTVITSAHPNRQNLLNIQLSPSDKDNGDKETFTAFNVLSNQTSKKSSQIHSKKKKKNKKGKRQQRQDQMPNANFSLLGAPPMTGAPPFMGASPMMAAPLVLGAPPMCVNPLLNYAPGINVSTKTVHDDRAKNFLSSLMGSSPVVPPAPQVTQVRTSTSMLTLPAPFSSSASTQSKSNVLGNQLKPQVSKPTEAPHPKPKIFKSTSFDVDVLFDTEPNSSLVDKVCDIAKQKGHVAHFIFVEPIDLEFRMTPKEMETAPEGKYEALLIVARREFRGKDKLPLGAQAAAARAAMPFVKSLSNPRFLEK